MISTKPTLMNALLSIRGNFDSDSNDSQKTSSSREFNRCRTNDFNPTASIRLLDRVLPLSSVISWGYQRESQRIVTGTVPDQRSKVVADSLEYWDIKRRANDLEGEIMPWGWMRWKVIHRNSRYWYVKNPNTIIVREDIPNIPRFVTILFVKTLS
jgi:hypothetical protein